MKQELIYLVLGGGLGGAWVNKDGKVMFPAVDWDGKEESLHYTNEPGYAVPLWDDELSDLFTRADSRMDYFDFKRTLNKVIGPSLGPYSSIRAETIVSGTGMSRLLKFVATGNPVYRDMQPNVLDDLAAKGDLTALTVYELFGVAFGLTASKVVNAAVKDGASKSIDVYIGGKPSRAFPYFARAAEIVMFENSVHSTLNVSVIDEKGGNARLEGALVLADRLRN